MSKCFLLTPGKNLAQIRAIAFEKNVKTALHRCTQFHKNDVTMPKATLITMQTSRGQFQQPFAFSYRLQVRWVYFWKRKLFAIGCWNWGLLVISELSASARWCHFCGMECVGVKRFLRFSRKRQKNLHLFSGFRRFRLSPHLFVKVPRPGDSEVIFTSSSQAATCYYQTNHSLVEAIPLSALPKDRRQRSDLYTRVKLPPVTTRLTTHW